MAQAETASTLFTYGDVSRVEDVVLNAIEILTAKETQIFNMLGKTSAKDTIHSYLVDTLKSAESNAQMETTDYQMLTRTTPTRLTNVIQILAVPFRVSRTQQEVDHYHGQNELQRQVNKALVEWANDAEYNLLRSTLTSGASGYAPTMSGIFEAISKSTNYTAHSSGTLWSASVLDGLMKANWDNSNGDVASDLFMGSALRKRTDDFTQKTNVVVNGGGMTTIVKTVSTYQTAFGTLSIHTHRYMHVSGTDATAGVLALAPEKLRVAFLRKPYIDTGLQRGGDYDPRAVVGKFTLEVRNQDSNWYSTGFYIG